MVLKKKKKSIKIKQIWRVNLFYWLLKMKDCMQSLDNLLINNNNYSYNYNSNNNFRFNKKNLYAIFVGKKIKANKNQKNFNNNKKDKY